MEKKLKMTQKKFLEKREIEVRKGERGGKYKKI